MEKTKSKKALTLLSIILMSVMILGIFAQSGVFVSANGGDDDDDDDDDDEREIEIEIEDGIAEIEVEIGDSEWEFTLRTSNLDEIIEEIALRTGLSSDEISDLMELKIKGNDDDDDDDEREIEVKIKDGKAEIEVEIGDSEFEFEMDTTDLDEIIEEIALRTGLSIDEINDIIEVEIKDDDDDDDDKKRFQRIRISPKKQFTSDGIATYAVTVRDLHTDDEVCTFIPDPVDNSTNGDNSTNDTNTNSTGTTVCEAVEYTYNLEFEAKNTGVSGEFDLDEITLDAGTSETVVLIVETLDRGEHKFTVISVGVDSEAKAKGKIIFIEEIDEPIKDVSFFNGDGFILTDDDSDGFLVDLKILNKDGILSGKVKIGKINYKIEGIILSGDSGNGTNGTSNNDTSGNGSSNDTSNNDTSGNGTNGTSNNDTSNNTNNETNSTDTDDVVGIEFDLISPRTKEVVGSFSGNVKTFNSFLLLRGSLEDFENSTWDLTATSKQKRHVREIHFGEGINEKKKFRESVKIKQIFSLTYLDASGEEAEAYLIPVKIGKKKFLRIIPNPFAEDALLFEVIKGDKISKKYIVEYQEEIIEGFLISTGSLEDEESIDLEIEEIGEE